MRRLGRRQFNGARTVVMLLAVGTVGVVSSPAFAAEQTEIIDSFSRDGAGAVDTSLTVSWEMQLREGRILREFSCLAHDTVEGGGGELCPGGSQYLLARELVARRETHLMNIDTAIAYRRYFKANLRIPVVLHELTELEFDAGVNRYNSSVDPYNFPSLFRVPHTARVRSGVKDPTLTLRFAPLSFARDPARATWVLDLAVTTGLVPVRQAGDTNVGEGTWRLDLGTAISVRPEWWVEPWFRMDTFLSFQDAGSLFEDYAPTQTLTSPGHAIAASVGTTFIPYESTTEQSTLTIDIGTRIHYRFEGREYTDLFEALGTSACDPLDPNEPCTLTTYDREKNDAVAEEVELRKTDGVTDVEQYATLSGWLGLRYQIVEWVSIRSGFSLAYEFPHFITFADAGVDIDKDGAVHGRQEVGDSNEYSPVYADALDGLGNRFRTGGMMTYGVTFALQGKF